MSTPWGNPQGITEVVKGIDWVITGSHGGLRVKNAIVKKAGLAPLLRKIPAAAFYESHHWWFEEDCAWSIAVLLLPEHFSKEELEMAFQTAEQWFPDEYEIIQKEKATEHVHTEERRAKNMTGWKFDCPKCGVEGKSTAVKQAKCRSCGANVRRHRYEKNN